jgi:hypothetical protein
MTNSADQNYVDRLRNLAAKLAQCPDVTKFDTVSEKQAWTMAHAFTDLEGSFRTFLDEQLPRLMNEDLTPQEIHDLLVDIGEEFRHILYHMTDSEFYKRLLEPMQQG